MVIDIMNKIIELKNKSKVIRKSVVRMTTKARIGHVTSSFSCMEILIALYYGGFLKYKVEDNKWKERDYFIMSKGHANPALYCVLMDLGYVDKSEIDKFCTKDGKLGVLLRGDIPGVEITSGSLGCGLGISAGIAEALNLNNMSNKIFCLLGDAECREGAIWEAAMHIGYRKLKNVVVIVDMNGMGATHFVEKEAGIEPIDKKFCSFGFDVKVINGHSFEEIIDAFENLNKKLPTCIIAKTVKGKGVSFIENEVFLHGMAIKQNLLDRAIKEIQEGDIE